jgi:hypothetical protein
MNRNLIGITWLCILSCSPASLSATKDLELTLRSDKPRYKLGDKISFYVNYTNRSKTSLWLLPETQAYLIDVLTVEKLNSKSSVEKIRGSNDAPSVALDGLAEEAAKIMPQGHLSRTLTAELRPTLPEWYGDQRKGIFLVLSGSALLLPGPGRYSIRAQLHSSPDHPVNRYLPHGAKLWRGDVISDPIVITIE